jgi:hypothetical protein
MRHFMDVTLPNFIDATQGEGHDFSRATRLQSRFGFSRWGLLFPA